MNEQTLRRRLELLGAGPPTSDWAAARGRAEGLQRRRNRLTIAVAVLVAIVVAAPTFAVATGAIDFWSTQPAPESLRKLFSELERATSQDLQGRTPTAHFGEARVLFRRELGGIGQTLFVAPQKGGGVCLYLLEDRVPGGGSGAAGCADAGNPLQPTGMRLQAEEPPYLVYGSSAASGATHVEMLLTDGTSRKEELVWISEPIDAGIYLLQVPANQGIRGFVVRDADGRELARRTPPLWN